MKRIVNYVLSIAAAAVAVAAIVSCDEKSGGVELGSIQAASDPLVLSCEANASAPLQVEFGAGWKVVNQADWFTVEPSSGDKGEYTLNIAAPEANDAAAELVDTLTIQCGQVSKNWYVVRRGVLGFSIDGGQTEFSGVANAVINLHCSEGIEIEVSSDSDWITGSVLNMETESSNIGGTDVKSEYYPASLVVSFANNVNEEDRSAKVTLKYGDITTDVTVHQIFRTYYRRSLALRFTATWCQWCPSMGEAVDMAIEETGDRIVPFNCHPTTSGDGLGWSGTSVLLDRYNPDEEFPMGIFNSYARISNASSASKTSEAYVGLSDEAVSEVKATTCISAESNITAGNLEVNVNILTGADHEYKVGVFVLENNVVAFQTNGGDDYVHNHVVRQNITAVEGDQFESKAGEISTLRFSEPLSSSIKSIDNAYLVIYVTYAGSVSTNSVDKSNVTYEDYGLVVDNAVTLPLRGSVEFQYEEE